MKKSIIGAIIALFAALFIFIPKAEFPAYAFEEDEVEENLEDAVNNTLNDLDLSGFDEFLSQLEDYNDNTFSKGIRQLVNEVLNGNDSISFSGFMKSLGKILLGEMANLLPQLLLIIVIALLFGVLQNLSSGFAKVDTKKIVFLACYGLILAIVTYMIGTAVTKAIKTFALIGKFNDICFPVLVTLVAALGGGASAAVYQPLVLVFGTVLLKIITVVIMPLFYITLVFGMVGNLGDNLKLDKFSKTAKSAAQWILGITFSLFITFLTTKGITGASFDSLAAKGAKYVLSSYIPIVGSYLKEGFDIVVAGCIVVKNALGACSVFIILSIAVIPIIKILIMSFGFKLTAAVLEPVSDTKFSSALFSVAESLKILIIAIACAALSVLIMIMMIIYTCNFGVL